jgi:hypothetical protein
MLPENANVKVSAEISSRSSRRGEVLRFSDALFIRI